MSTGYTRQSSVEIVTGNVINASDFNNEFNQLQSTFDATVGHAHDGTTGGGAAINYSSIANAPTLGTAAGQNIAFFLQSANNLSDLANSSTALTNLGALAVSKNLSDLSSVTTARTNLGLGTISTQNASSVAITGGTITGLNTPVNPSDAATKSYVDALPAYIYGFTLSNDVSNPNTVIDVSAGRCTDSTTSISITGTAFTKSVSGSWVSGSGHNGLGVGVSLTTNTWYHVFAIINNGLYDVYFDTSVTAANKPTNTTAFRRIGSILINGSSFITTFVQFGQRIVWSNGFNDLSTSSPPQSATLFKLTIPPGISVYPVLDRVSYSAGGGTVGNLIIGSPGMTATNSPSVQFLSLLNGGGPSIYYVTNHLLSNTNSQLNYLTGSNTDSVSIITGGWIDPHLSPVW